MSASAAGGLGSMGRSEAPHFAALHESENGPERTCRRLVLMSAFRVPVQPVMQHRREISLLGACECTDNAPLRSRPGPGLNLGMHFSSQSNVLDQPPCNGPIRLSMITLSV